MKLEGKKAKEAWGNHSEEQRFFALIRLGHNAAKFFKVADLQHADLLHPNRKSKSDKPDHTLTFKSKFKTYIFTIHEGEIKVTNKDNMDITADFLQNNLHVKEDESVESLLEYIQTFVKSCFKKE